MRGGAISLATVLPIGSFVLAVMMWLAMLAHGYASASHLQGMAWHGHEMLFGFAGTLMVGFLLTAGRTWAGELHNRRKDGTFYVESATIAPLRASDGRITHYIGIKADITEKTLLRMVGTGFNSVVWGIQVAAPAMTRSGGGSIINIASAAGFWGRVLGAFSTLEFDSQSRIGLIDAPVWMLHGSADQVVPVALGRRLWQAAPAGAKAAGPFVGGAAGSGSGTATGCGGGGRWSALGRIWPAGTMPTRTCSPSASHCSCITIASAPGGTCAPVKMRAAVPGCSGWPTTPAGMRWLTGSSAPSAGTSAQRSA